jgi:hypothetical protein
MVQMEVYHLHAPVALPARKELCIGDWLGPRTGANRHKQGIPAIIHKFYFPTAPGTRWIGGWVDPRAGLDNVEKRKFLTLPGLELRPLSRPARSLSIYRLRYIHSPHTPSWRSA